MPAQRALHPWPSDAERAIDIQCSLRDRLELSWDGRPVHRVGGVDVAYRDGQGIAHPRRFGLAAHLGMWLDVPSIGVAKSHLYGNSLNEPGPLPGDFTPLLDEKDSQQVIGAVLRTRSGSQPLYVSPGHRMDVENAVLFVVHCCRGHRLPEPSRMAHQLST